MPVVINSGSGNQGLTVSLPVLEYAREYGKSREELYRALAVANLCAIHQKTAIGKLSAYCGAVTAGSGAGAGIAYLLTGDYKTVAHTIVNALAIVSGHRVRWSQAFLRREDRLGGGRGHIGI